MSAARTVRLADGREISKDDWREPQKWERYDGPLVFADPAWGDPFTRGGLTDAGREALGIDDDTAIAGAA